MSALAAVLAVEIVVPADDRGIDEALRDVGLAIDELAPRLDQGGIALEAVVGEQEHLRLPSRDLGDGKGLGGHVALHSAVHVDDEGLRIERIGPHLRVGEAEFALEPLEVGGDAFLRDEQRQPLEVAQAVDAAIGVGNHHLRVLLEHRRDREGRNALRHRIERLQRVRAHEEVDAADRQQELVVHLRTALNDGHVEAVIAVSAVGQRLVEAAVLAFGDPVGAEHDFVGRVFAGRLGECRIARRQAGDYDTGGRNGDRGDRFSQRHESVLSRDGGEITRARSERRVTGTCCHDVTLWK